MKATYTLSFLIIFFAACQSQSVKTKGTSRDTTITASNSFSELFLDSIKLKTYIATAELTDTGANRLQNFYNSRNYQFPWFTKDGLAEQTRAFLNLHNNYIQLANDSSMGDKVLHEQMNELLNEDTYF